MPPVVKSAARSANPHALDGRMGGRSLLSRSLAWMHTVFILAFASIRRPSFSPVQSRSAHLPLRLNLARLLRGNWLNRFAENIAGHHISPGDQPGTRA